MPPKFDKMGKLVPIPPCSHKRTTFLMDGREWCQDCDEIIIDPRRPLD